MPKQFVHILSKFICHLLASALPNKDAAGRPGISALRDCSMVFQDYALYPHMTARAGRDVVGFGFEV
ncbi:MAG: hypothetical protein HKM95_10590 [Inquilinus sp.]|nr:hypothetical protein [Inquilinus sp.]